jgi:hypothetical protein
LSAIVRIALVSEVFLQAVDGVVTRLKRTLEGLERTGVGVPTKLVTPDRDAADATGHRQVIV